MWVNEWQTLGLPNTSVQIEMCSPPTLVWGYGEEQVNIGDSKTTPVLGKWKVLLKLTYGKTMALSDVLHVPSIRFNLIFVALLGKVGG